MRRGRTGLARRVVGAIVLGCIALGVVLLIPAAPGQTGGGGGAPLPGGAIRTPDQPPQTQGAAPLTVAPAPNYPYRPFIDPIDTHRAWFWLLIPMAFGISVVYKAVRLQTLERYWAQVLFLTVQIVVAMVLLGAASYGVVMVFAPMIAAR